MTENDFLMNEDSFDSFDPISGGIDDPGSIEPEPEPLPEPDPLPDPEPGPENHPSPSSIGSNNSGWPCACTGLYI